MIPKVFAAILWIFFLTIFRPSNTFVTHEFGHFLTLIALTLILIAPTLIVPTHRTNLHVELRAPMRQSGLRIMNRALFDRVCHLQTGCPFWRISFSSFQRHFACLQDRLPLPIPASTLGCTSPASARTSPSRNHTLLYYGRLINLRPTHLYLHCIYDYCSDIIYTL